MTSRGYNGGPGTGPVSTDTRGLPVFENPEGVQLTLGVVPPLSALHDDPSFEDPALAAYEDFFHVGTTSVTSVTSPVFADDRAALFTLGAASAQLWLSSVFPVVPGDLIEHGVFAAAVSGQPTLGLGLLTCPSGDPLPFDAATYDSETPQELLAETYTQQRRTFSVPAGHYFGRLQWRVDTLDSLAAEAVLDLSFSSRTGTAIPSLLWGQAALTTDTAPSGTTATSLPGMSVTLAAAGTTSVFQILMTADVAFSGGQTNIVELLVDGTPVGSTINSQATAAAVVGGGIRFTQGQHWTIDGLAPGDHVFEAQTRNTAAGSNATVRTGHSKITVTRISG